MDGEEAVQEEKVELNASTEAVEFLSSIEPRELQECLFTDSLVTESDMGRELGEFRVSVQAAGYNGKPCYLVHANSHGAIDNNPCGTSIMAYLTCGLETLEHNHHEYLKLKDYTLDRKVHMVRQDGQLIVKKVICEREEVILSSIDLFPKGELAEILTDHVYHVSTSINHAEEVKKRAFSFPLDSLQGFVSEASNLLILRVLARRKKVPENMTFLSFNTETRVSLSTYRDLGQKKQMVETEVVDVFGIERTISTKEDDLATWQCYFLFDGHLASRVQVGSPARMKLLQLPVHSSQEEEDLKPVFEKRPLVWEEDMELYIKFLERKEELKADHSSYVKHHPELKALLADFLQFLLLRKPHDVFSFAQDYFAPFSSRQPPGGAFHSARTLRLPERQEIDKP